MAGFLRVAHWVLIYDIDKDLEYATASSFADDTRLTMAISSLADYVKMQSDLGKT